MWQGQATRELPADAHIKAQGVAIHAEVAFDGMSASLQDRTQGAQCLGSLDVERKGGGTARSLLRVRHTYSRGRGQEAAERPTGPGGLRPPE